MCIQLHWDESYDNVLHMTFEEGWTLQAYYHSIAALECMVNTKPNPVTVIMNMSAADTPNLRLQRGRRIDESLATQNVHRILLVDPGYFSPQVNCPVQTVDSLEEAFALLYEEEQALLA